jgi:hypothetical protein
MGYDVYGTRFPSVSRDMYAQTDRFLFHLCQAFSTIQRKKHLPRHCCIAFLSFTLILSQQIFEYFT